MLLGLCQKPCRLCKHFGAGATSLFGPNRDMLPDRACVLIFSLEIFNNVSVRHCLRKLPLPLKYGGHLEFAHRSPSNLKFYDVLRQ